MSLATGLRQVILIVSVAAFTMAAGPSVAEPRLLWEHSYDGGTGHHDHATQLVETQSAIYVAASTQDSQNPPDFTVLRYSLDGELRWERHHGGMGERAGQPSDIAAVRGGGVIVTGLTRLVESALATLS